MESVHAHPFVTRIARILLSLVFLSAGIQRLGDFQGAADYIAASGLPFPMFLSVSSSIVEVGLGLMLLFDLRARYAAIGLAVYLVVVTFSLHDFWTLSGEAAAMQRNNFMKNLAIIGGLLAVYAEAPARVHVHDHHPPGVFREGDRIQLP